MLMQMLMLLSLLLVLSAPGVSAVPLMEDYPDFFGSQPILVVVGDSAPSTDVVAATDIVNYIVYATHSNNVSSALASEVGSYNRNIISIGSPCNNPVTKFILGTDSCNLTDRGDAIIKTLNGPNSHAYVVVAGNTNEATRVAAKVLQEPDKYNLDGSELCVFGTTGNPHVEPCATSTYIPPSHREITFDSSIVDKQKQPPKPVQTATASVEVEKKPEVETNFTCPGCKDETGVCYTTGERTLVKGMLAYCKSDQKWYPVKDNEKTCKDNYQCKSGFCVDGKCSSEAPEEESFIIRFFGWIWGLLFG